jgi:succinoglycan biosynthesis transport protein ExoP
MNSLRTRSLTDYLYAARRHKLIILVPAVVITVASAVAIKQLPNVYESSISIKVESPQAEGSLGQALPDLQRRMTTIHQQVTSRTLLERLIEKHGLYREMAGNAARGDDVISRMRGDISVDVNKVREDSVEAFKITYRSTDPVAAQKVAADLAGQLIADNVQAMQSQASGEADVLRQHAAELSSKLHELEQKDPWLLTLKEDMPVTFLNAPARSSQPSVDAVRAQQMTIEGLKDQQYKLQQQITDVERDIAEQRRVVEQQKKGAPLRADPTYAALVAKKAELQGQRNNLINRQELTDKHPRVLAINDQLAEIEKQLADLRQQSAGFVSQSPDERELRRLETERNRLKTELEVTNRAIERQVANPPRVAATSGPVAPPSPAQRDASSARLAQDYLGLKQSYKETVSKLQDAELARQTIGSAKVEQFRILDQANLPQRPSWPNRRFLGLIALAAGLAAGACFAVLAEMRRLSSLQDARDVEHYTRLPLLAAIPKSMTRAERERERRRARMRLAIGGAVAVVATLALTKILLANNLFAMLGK